MGSSIPRKNGNLVVMDGGLARRPLTADEWLEREWRSWSARGKVGGTGRYACRALEDTAQGLRFPNRIPARILAAGLEGGAPVEWAEEAGPILTEYARRKARELGRLADRPEPTPPAGAMPVAMTSTGEHQSAA